MIKSLSKFYASNRANSVEITILMMIGRNK